MTSTTLSETKLSDAELAEFTRYDPGVDRVFSVDRGQKVLVLGHECNTPIHDLCGLGFVVCQDQPATWRARVKWRFPTISGHERDRLTIWPKFDYRSFADLDQDVAPLMRGEPWTPRTDHPGYHEKSWAPDFPYRFALARPEAQRVARGTIGDLADCYRIRLTSGHPDHVERDLVTVAEVIEAIATTPAGLLGRESDHCCFCGRGLTDVTSRALGYGPDCAERYGLPRTPTYAIG
jgi:hypothetical protein